MKRRKRIPKRRILSCFLLALLVALPFSSAAAPWIRRASPPDRVGERETLHIGTESSSLPFTAPPPMEEPLETFPGEGLEEGSSAPPESDFPDSEEGILPESPSVPGPPSAPPSFGEAPEAKPEIKPETSPPAETEKPETEPEIKPETSPSLPSEPSVPNTPSDPPASGSEGEPAYREDELYWLSRIIEAEAGGEPYAGKIAVGTVVMNRVKDRDYPNTVYGVIFDRKYGVQFTPVANGRIYCTPSAESVRAAKEVLLGKRTNHEILFFLNPSIASDSWFVRNLEYHFRIGGHVFYGRK